MVVCLQKMIMVYLKDYSVISFTAQLYFYRLYCFSKIWKLRIALKVIVFIFVLHINVNTESLHKKISIIDKTV